MTLRVAIVGMGGIGNNHGRCYSNHPEAEVVAVCDIIQERSDKAAEDLRLSRLLLRGNACSKAASNLTPPASPPPAQRMAATTTNQPCNF